MKTSIAEYECVFISSAEDSRVCYACICKAVYSAIAKAEGRAI